MKLTRITYLILIIIQLITCAHAGNDISTIAGTGTAGYGGDAGPATAAQLNTPYAVAIDTSGAIYIADTGNNRIRKIDSSGHITTLAGDGIAGNSGDNGPATTAQLNGPKGLAIDSTGIVYIADTGNSRIRQIDTSGTITTVIGTDAQLNAPTAIALDSSGNIYIAEPTSHRVRQWEKSSGKITLFAGNEVAGDQGDGNPATRAQLNTPTGVALDSSGNVYIADTANHRIRKVDRTSGTISTVTGSHTGDLSKPEAVAVSSSGIVYIADTGNNRLRQLDSSGTLSTVTTDLGSPLGLKAPSGLILASNGDLIIADTQNHRLRKLGSSTTTPPTDNNDGNSGGSTFTLTLNKAGAGSGTVTAPKGSATGIDCGTTCTENYPANTTVTLTATAAASSQFSGWSGDCSGTTATVSVTVDKAKTCTATFKLASSGGTSTSVMTYNGAVVNDTANVSGLDGVTAVAVSPDGLHVYAASFRDNAVAVFSRDPSNGALTWVQAVTTTDVSGDGLLGASAVAVSPDGKHVYVASISDSTVSVFTRQASTGLLTLVEMIKDGVNGVDTLAGASGIAISPDNTRVYVVATQDNAITAFERNPNTGVLRLLTAQVDGLNGFDGLAGAKSVAVSADSQSVYVASSSDNAVVALTKELVVISVYKNGVNNVSGLNGAYGIASSLTTGGSSDYVYVVSNNDNALVVFKRDTTTGALTFTQVLKDGVNDVNGLSGARAVTATSQKVYVTGMNDSALAVFNRDATSGQLSFAGAMLNNSAGVLNLNGPTAVATTADGVHVYVAALFSNAVVGFGGVTADLALTHNDITSVAVNSPLVYVLTLTNNGPDDAATVTLTDTLPSGVVFGSATASQGECTAAATTVTCAIGALKSGTSATVTLNLTSPAQVGSGTLVNKATLSGSQPDAVSANNSIEKSTQLVELLATADLDVSVATKPDAVDVSSALTYTVTVTNKGPEAATAVVLTNTLPTGTVFVSADPRCSHASGVVSCQLANLAKGAVADFVMQVTTAATPGTLTFTATAKATESDPTPNTVTKTTAVASVVMDLKIIDATATPNSVNVTDKLKYTLKIANVGGATATDVVLTATLPLQVKLISADNGCSESNGQVTCKLDTLADKTNPANNQQFTLEVQALQPGQAPGQPLNPLPLAVTVTAKGSDGDPTNNSGTANLYITGDVADLAVSIEDGGNAVLVDTPISYTVTVTNNGPSASGEVKLNLALSGGGDNVVIDSVSGGTCTSGLTFSCTLATIAGGSSQKVAFTVTPKAAGTVKLNAEAAGTIFDPTLPNSDSQQTAVTSTSADLGIKVTAAPSPTLPETPFIYTVEVKNAGPSQATGVLVTHTLPAGVTLVKTESSQGTCIAAATVITCDLGPLNKDSTATINVTVTATTVGSTKSSVTVRSDMFDPKMADNSADVSVEISQSKADLGITMTASPDPATVDSPLTYTVTLTNAGADVATGITVTDTLPTGVVFTGAAAGQCQEQAGVVTCSVDTLGKGEEITLEIETLPTVPGELVNTASVAGREYDPETTNNTATLKTNSTTPATLFFTAVVKNGVEGVQGLQRVTALALSPDGLHVYAAGFGSNALTAFNRHADTGKLTFAQVVIDGVNGVDGLAGASGIAMSADGSYVYATGFNDNAISVFSRNPTTGTLTWLQTLKDGENNVDGIGGAYHLTISGNTVYVAGLNDDAIAVFNRGNDGRLTFQTAIFGSQMTPECAQPGSACLDGVNALAVSANGTFLVAVSANSDTVTIFKRDTTSGVLTFAQNLTNGQEGVTGIDSARAVIISADNRYIYVAGAGTDNAIALFSHEQSSVICNTSPCLSPSAWTFVGAVRNGSNGITGLNGVYGLALSPDGQTLYASGSNDNAVVAFKRNASSGTLTFSDSLKDGVNGSDGLGGARALALSPEGGTIYVAGFADDGIAVLSVATADLNVSVRDSADPVNVGTTVTYTATVTNAGPRQATAVTWTAQLTGNAQWTSYTPSQGQCTLTADVSPSTLTCTLGTLAVNATATISVVATPKGVGQLELVASMQSQQFDATPATATETTQVKADADLSVKIQAKSALATVESTVSYGIEVSNQGPDDADNIKVVLELPALVEFKTAQVGSETAVCSVIPPDTAGSSVICTLPWLLADTTRILTLTVATLTTPGQFSVTVNVSSDAYDAVLANNSAAQVVEITQKIIEGQYNNSDKTLHNYIISATGAVNGGQVSGTIQNQGLLTDVHVLPGTTVNGGRLAGTITNEGTLVDVQLMSNTVVNGGILQGTISGNQPCTLNARIAAGSYLTNVTLAAGSEIDPTVILGPGVLFKTSVNIPAGIDLTPILPTLAGGVAVNLSTDVLEGAGNILAAINALPDLQNNGLVFTQSATGQLLLRLGEDDVVLVPTRVQQATAEQVAGITLNNDGSVTFITDTRRVVTAQPSVQDVTALQTALAVVGLPAAVAGVDGNWHIPVAGVGYYNFRPDRMTQPTTVDVGTVLDARPSTLVQEASVYFLHFGTTDQPRQQFLYPAAAHLEELQVALAGFPGASTVSVGNGFIAVKIGGRTYTGVFDYRVTTGPAAAATQVLIVSDQNGDGSEDVSVVYKNGDQQVIYVVPIPDWVTAIGAIPAVKTAGWVASSDAEGHLTLTQGYTRQLLAVTNIMQVDENTPPTWISYSDGNAVFVTDSGQRLAMQPVVQDMAALQTDLATLGLTVVLPQDNGHLRVPLNPARLQGDALYARPDVTSTLAAITRPLGLQSIPASLPGVSTALWVFRDEQGNKRQQLLYPAAADPVALAQFLLSMPQVKGVEFAQGQMRVTLTDSTMRGIFAYAVVGGFTPSGGIQFTVESDANGDGVDDFAVIYGNGQRQLIYQLP